MPPINREPTDAELLEAAQHFGMGGAPNPQPLQAQGGMPDAALIEAARFHGLDVPQQTPPVMSPEGQAQNGPGAPATGNQESLLDRGVTLASTAASAVKHAATGEGRVEFPDVPEMTDADIGFFESFVPNLKLGLTIDPMEKANIIATSFKDDPRFGGAFQDKHGNPIIRWEGQPFYVNKPGASMQDLNDVVAQGVQLVPAAKLAGAAKTGIGRLAAGVPAYGATSLAQQYGTVAAGGKDKVDLGQAGELGVIGGVTEAALPPLAKALGRPIKAGVQSVQKRFRGTPALAPDIPATALAPDSPRIPLTQGQRAGDMNLIRREEAMRQGAMGDAASGTMRNFDDLQANAIRGEADTVQGAVGAGTGFDSPNIANLGAQLQGGLIQARDTAKAGVKSAYDAAGKLDARISTEHLSTLGKSIRDGLHGMPLEEGMTPAAISALKEVGKLGKTPGVRITELTLRRLETTRRKLGNYIGAAANSTDKRAATIIKSKLDEWTNDAVDRALFSGDPEALSALKNARSLRRDYALKFEAGKTASGAKDPAGNVMVKILDEAQATPEQVINYITGYGRITSDAKAVGLTKRIKSVFGPNSHEVKMLKDAFLLKAFTAELRGQREITASAIVKGANEFLYGRGLTLGRELFSPAERRQIGNFAAQVGKTITPGDARNPSRSAFAIFKLLQDNNLLTVTGKTLKPVPFANELGGAIESAGGAITARNATSQLERLTSFPLVDAGAAASADKARRSLDDQLRRMAPNVVPLPSRNEVLAQELLRETQPTNNGPLADMLTHGR